MEGSDCVAGQLRGDKECPFSGVTKSGRVWRKVLESDARSVYQFVSCRCVSHALLSCLISELLHVYTPSCTLCSSSDTCMLKIQQYKHKSHGFCAFSCFGLHMWNSLPQDLRHCSTLSSFKDKLKTFLFSQYFHTS